MSILVQKDELEELTVQAYQDLMSIGANVPAEKIILGDLSADNKFNLSESDKCVVGWARKCPINKKMYYYRTSPSWCIECYDFACELLDDQGRNRLTFSDRPKKQFLLKTIEFVKHFKEA